MLFGLPVFPLGEFATVGDEVGDDGLDLRTEPVCLPGELDVGAPAGGHGVAVVFEGGLSGLDRDREPVGPDGAFTGLFGQCERSDPELFEPAVDPVDPGLDLRDRVDVPLQSGDECVLEAGTGTRIPAVRSRVLGRVGLPACLLEKRLRPAELSVDPGARDRLAGLLDTLGEWIRDIALSSRDDPLGAVEFRVEPLARFVGAGTVPGGELGRDLRGVLECGDGSLPGAGPRFDELGERRDVASPGGGELVAAPCSDLDADGRREKSAGGLDAPYVDVRDRDDVWSGRSLDCKDELPVGRQQHRLAAGGGRERSVVVLDRLRSREMPCHGLARRESIGDRVDESVGRWLCLRQLGTELLVSFLFPFGPEHTRASRAGVITVRSALQRYQGEGLRC